VSSPPRNPSVERYGKVAVVAGASEGLGAAFATALAARGHDLVLLARRAAVLDALAAQLRSTTPEVDVRCVACDLADAAFVPAMHDAIAGREVGIGVYNAAFSAIGPLLDRPLEDALRVIDVNVKGPVRFVHALGPEMRLRKRGALVLMSSLAGFHGSPRIATYAASKAFNIVLGESLWGELRAEGVDVLVSGAGAIRTPGYTKTNKPDAPGTLDPSQVAERTLGALGHGPLVVPGAVNKLATFFLGRVISRAGAVAIMQKNTADLDA